MENTPAENRLRILQALPDPQQLAEDLQNKYKDAGSVGFLCYDIASLRKINHVYGRGAGDALLAAAAEYAAGLGEGKLYRVEGDLFCLLYLNTDLNCIYHHASSLDARFGHIWHLELERGTVDIYAQASIAVLSSLGPGYHLELPDLFERALEISRRDRQITIFNQEHDRMTREHIRLQMELKNCIFSGMQGFDVFYQPLADPTSGTWRGLEALCRWAGPTIGAVPPNIFIQEAEEMGLIHPLGDWVLDTALETCKELRLDHLDNFFVSVNVSAMQLVKRNYVRTVLDTIEKHQYPCDKLVLEITESTQFTFNNTTFSAIEMLRAKGIMIALDDFGSGYSGFSNLKNLPADILKTDREFIDNIENDGYLQYFYYIMSETAHTNGMRLIAEGIENREQLQSVVKNGADLVQGYLFGRPMDRYAVEERKDSFTRTLETFTGWKSRMDDFKQWINGQDAYQITPALFRLQSKCISTILDERDLDRAVNRTLGIVGAHFKVNRAYVFLRDEAAIFSNRYEWCAPGVESQIHLFQKVDGSQDGFYKVLRENEVVIANNAEQLPAKMQERLQEGNQSASIQSMVVMPMRQRGEILGFVGFDDTTDRDWMPEELIILHNLCLLCLIILARSENTDAPHTL